VKHKKEMTMYMKYNSIVKHKKEVTMCTSFLCFTTQSCTSCTLSTLLHISLHRVVLLVRCHLFFMFHYTQLYFMYVVNSFLCFTTHRAVLLVHCHLFFCFTTELKHKNEVTTYMKYSCV
jgi:hypothetical protein